MKKLLIVSYCAVGLLSACQLAAEARRAYSYSGSSDEQVEYVYEVEGEPKKAQSSKPSSPRRRANSQANAAAPATGPAASATAKAAPATAKAASATAKAASATTSMPATNASANTAVAAPSATTASARPIAPNTLPVTLPRTQEAATTVESAKPTLDTASSNTTTGSASAATTTNSDAPLGDSRNRTSSENDWFHQALQQVTAAIQSVVEALMQAPKAWTSSEGSNNLAGGGVLGAYTPTPAQFPEQSVMQIPPARTKSTPKPISAAARNDSVYEFTAAKAATFKPMLIQKANQGDARAALALGAMYMDGHGIAKDLDAARRWLEKAHNAKARGSAARLGTLYVTTSGKDSKLYQKGCDLLFEGTKEHDVLSYETLATVATRNGRKEFALDMWRMAKQFGSKVAESKLKELGSS